MNCKVAYCLSLHCRQPRFCHRNARKRLSRCGSSHRIKCCLQMCSSHRFQSLLRSNCKRGVYFRCCPWCSPPKSIFFCQKHSGMGFVVYDEDFCCDWIVSWECKSSLIGWFFLTVRYLLICAVRYELKDLQVIFSLDFHAVNAVPEYYLSDERHGVCYASCDITLIVEHTSSPLPGTKNPRSNYASGKFLCAVING